MWLYHRTLKITWRARAPTVDRSGLRVKEEQTKEEKGCLGFGTSGNGQDQV